MHMAFLFVGWGLPHHISVGPRDGGASPTLQVVAQGRRFLNQAYLPDIAEVIGLKKGEWIGSDRVDSKSS